jgi:hypothetical protein
MRPGEVTDGEELARLLGRFGYEKTHESESHMRLTSSARGKIHHMTVPLHSPPVGWALKDVAIYLETDVEKLKEELFK